MGRMTAREAGKERAVEPVDRWIGDCVEITGDRENGVTKAEAVTCFTSWAAMVEETTPEGVSLTALREVIVERMVASGAVLDKHTGRVVGVRIR